MAALFGLCALLAAATSWAWGAADDGIAALGPADERRAGADPSATPGATGLLSREIMVGGYGGISHTHQSTVTIVNPGRTDMTVSGFPWEGRPFKSPIYYGLRAIAWQPSRRLGAMLDFTHAKAIADFGAEGAFTGTHDGKPLLPKAKMGDVFKHLEFSHGHNMVTLNGLLRLGTLSPRLSPYVGLGAGISLPHTEIAFRTESGRTYEYQFAGGVAQVLGGIEVRLGRSSVFVEYKLSYAPYDVPLSGVVNGWLLVTDLWRQFRAWAGGERPPGGTLRTTLISHHGIAGALVRVSGRPAP